MLLRGNTKPFFIFLLLLRRPLSLTNPKHMSTLPSHSSMASHKSLRKRASREDSSSQQQPPEVEDALSLIPDDLMESYSSHFKNRKVIKQFMLFTETLRRLHLQQVMELIEFQNLGTFL